MPNATLLLSVLSVVARWLDAYGLIHLACAGIEAGAEIDTDQGCHPFDRLRSHL